MSTIPYTCTRCGYNTNEKFKMVRHFTERKTKCQGKINDIELTDFIKDKILANRIYRIPIVERLKTNHAKSKPIIDGNERHYIYLVKPRDNVAHNENVYKIGKTILREITTTFTRVNKYGRGTELILIAKCIDAHVLERDILDVFNNNFNRHTFGDEYFIGDCDDMVSIIFDMVKDQKLRFKNNQK